MKIGPPKWIDADFEFRNIPVDDPHKKTLSIKKQQAKTE